MRDYRDDLSKAITHFWNTRERQSKRQGSATDRRDQGARSSVTGGKQLDGFVELIHDIAVEAGIDESSIHFKRHLELPGYYRPEKKWDLIIVEKDILLAALEFKSQVALHLAITTTTELRRRLGMRRTSGPPTERERSRFRSGPGWGISCFWKTRKHRLHQ